MELEDAILKSEEVPSEIGVRVELANAEAWALAKGGTIPKSEEVFSRSCSTPLLRSQRR